MARFLHSKKNKSSVKYLVIILAFLLLVWFIYMFFKFKITAIENGTERVFRNEILIQ